MAQQFSACSTREQFFQTLAQDIHLPPAEADLLTGDFQALFDYYAAAGVPDNQALARLGSRPLQGFYDDRLPTVKYHNLFTDAWFPLSETRHNQNVWRVAAWLEEPVIPAVLQAAADLVLPDFPYFSTVLHHGFFWLDLWSVHRRIAVTPQRQRPGAPLKERRLPLFRVEYLPQAIVLEGRHALVDGNGCVLFMRALARTYLHLLGRELPPAVDSGITCSAQQFPTFQDVYGIPDSSQVPPSLQATRARHLAGKPALLQAAGYAALTIPTDRLLALAREQGVTVTALLSVPILLAIRDCLDPKERRGRIKLAIPVNLHQYYPLDTLRNYSMYVNIELEPEQVTDAAALLPEVARQLRTQNSPEVVGSMIGGFLKRAANPVLCALPAFFKWATLSATRILFWEKRTMTAIFSNIGVIPEEFGGNLDRFGVAVSAVKPIRRKVTLTTLGNTAMLTITKTTHDDAFEQALEKRLTQIGLPPVFVEP